MYQIKEICVSTPHNWGVIMGGRHKNFYDSIHKTQDMAIMNFEKGGFLLPTLYYAFLFEIRLAPSLTGP